MLEASVRLGNQDAVAGLLPRLIDAAPLLGGEGLGPTYTCAARILGEAVALLGDLEQARRYYEQALEVATKVRHRPEIALIRLGLAELLLAEADDLAAGLPRPTRQGEHTGSSLPDEATLRKDANEHLDFAITEFRVMKMTPSLERALSHKGLLKA